MSAQIETVAEWVESFREDIETLKAIVVVEDVDADARKCVAAALNYIVTRMDLIPDWNETIGVMDDVMVVRCCMSLASALRLDDGLPSDLVVDASRLVNEADTVEELIGEDLYSKLRKYCSRLSEEAVRNRTPQSILADADAREALWGEIEDDLRRMPATSFSDPEDVTVKLTSYLHAKLKDV